MQLGKKKKIELSLDEARELQQILADLLGLATEQKCTCNRITVIPAPPVVTIPYPVFPYPPTRRYSRWEVSSYRVGDFPSDGVITISSTGTGAEMEIGSSSGTVSNMA